MKGSSMPRNRNNHYHTHDTSYDPRENPGIQGYNTCPEKAHTLKKK